VLIVVDTLEKIRTPANGKAQLYSCDYGALSGLQKIAMQRGIALVINHHDRKSESDDIFDTVSGTLGLTGAADTILIVKRRSNGTTLHVRGRDIEESEKAIQFDKASCKWTILGEASEVHRSNERGRILAVLEEASKPLTPREVADLTGQSYDAVRQMLLRMDVAGEVTKEQRGRYGVTRVTESQRSESEDDSVCCEPL
jgi:predicted Rossmann fold nucleotide-binding protein DprA/Smf involved in DNA uptake